MNKVEPMLPILAEYDVWISGVRAEQSNFRSALSVVEDAKSGCQKFHPLLGWTAKMVFDYRKKFDLPEHPLEKDGFLSIGCEPCTRRYNPADPRSGRWFGLDKTECGLQTELGEQGKWKVVVTGGAGYLGTELVRQLINNPEISQILIYDNLSRGNYNVFLGEPKLSDKMKFLKADILDSRSFGKAIQDASLVYHLAARVTTPFADQHAHLFEQVNHWGTAEVTYEIEKSDVEHFVFLSSASVYGTSEEETGRDIKG